jgi:LacI family transcriptional regulator, galactose operon repressor
MMQSRVTLRDVAARAGVHHTTASRALKNDPRVCAETLAKIKTLAAEMGYMPDPMLSALNAYRHASRPSQFHGTVAWVTNYPTRDGWRSSWGSDRKSCYEIYYAGAEEQLARHGYKLEEFWLQEPRMTARRASQVLVHRGIRGLLLCPLPVSRGHLSLEWERFSAVSFGYSLARPKLHLFSAAHFRAVVTCMRKLRARGYHRIGLLTSYAMDERMDRMWTAAYRAEMPKLPQSKAIPIHLYSDGKKCASERAWSQIGKGALKWYRQYKPDAILTTTFHPLLGWLKAGGYRVPQDVALISATLQANEPLVSGIVEASHEIGMAAADFLAGMLQRGEHGVPRVAQRILLEGSWIEGKTAGSKVAPVKSMAAA